MSLLQILLWLAIIMLAGVVAAWRFLPEILREAAERGAARYARQENAALLTELLAEGTTNDTEDNF
jgi:hypothetical protein